MNGLNILKASGLYSAKLNFRRRCTLTRHRSCTSCTLPRLVRLCLAENPIAVSILGLLLISPAAFSLNPVPGWYVGMIGGGTYAKPVSFDLADVFTKPNVLPVINTLLNGDTTGRLTYLIGGNVGGQIGYRCGKFRIEVEGLFNETKYQSIKLGNNITLHNHDTPSGYSMSGYTYTAGGFINGIYEMYQPGMNITKWVPYVGLGIGAADVQNSLTLSYNNAVVGQVKEGNTTGIGQAIAGLSYFFDDFIATGIDYRYLITAKSGTFNTSYQAQTINLSFTYALG